MKTQKPLLKDEDGEKVDVHMYRSMIGSLIYLTSSRPDIMFAVCACARYQYPKDSPFDLVAYTDSDYAGASLDRKSTTRDGKKIIINESTMRRDLQLEDAEGIDCLPNSTIFEQLALMGKPKRKNTKVPQPRGSTENVADEAVHKERGDKLVTPNEASSLGTTSGGGPRCQKTIGDTIAQTRFENVSKISNDSLLSRGNTLRNDEDRMKLNELMELCTNLQTRVLDLEKTKTSQHNEINSMKRRGRKIDDINADEDITLVNDEVQNVVEEVVEDFNTVKLIVDAARASTAGEVSAASAAITVSAAATITTKEITLAQALMEIKTLKPSNSGVFCEDMLKDAQSGAKTKTFEDF
ncbi:hypothetical protein Tco_0727721 [Tanacetum coccineum]|uniref:Reverse transcriptase Ty1/copia-type domain-containing protein n=1 Tax=Tanacetum coccineum TaxID=301880 RepID=A0ABQ4YK26_9ASTR